MLLRSTVLYWTVGFHTHFPLFFFFILDPFAVLWDYFHRSCWNPFPRGICMKHIPRVALKLNFLLGNSVRFTPVAFGNCLNPFLVGTICFIKNIFAFQFFLIPMDVFVETLLLFLKRVPLPLLFLLLDCVCASNMRRPFSLEAINYFWDKQSLLV